MWEPRDLRPAPDTTRALYVDERGLDTAVHVASVGVRRGEPPRVTTFAALAREVLASELARVRAAGDPRCTLSAAQATELPPLRLGS